MIKYAPLDTKQVAYFLNSKNAWLNVLEGGKRAGKNILNIMAYADCLENHPDKLHLVYGVTKATTKMNIIDSNGFGLEHYFKNRCRSGTYMGVDCLYIKTATGLKIVLIVGGKDSDDYRTIKGFSLGSAYGSEANEVHQTFHQEVIDRTIASSDRKMFMDLNSKAPKHWFYADFLDFQMEQAKLGRITINYAHLTVWNNLSLSNAKLKEVLSTYDKTSLWYQADILGKRTSATGRCYPSYDLHKHIVPQADLLKRFKFTHFSIGVDVGGTDATVATLIGFTTGFYECILIDGYYHKQNKQSGMTHHQYAIEIITKIEDWLMMYPKLYTATIFAESADKLFRQALSNELLRRNLSRVTVVPSYKKDGIVDRIRLNNILFSQDRFFISSHMKQWLNAYQNATWDDEEYSDGDWVRVDDGSYEVDCLDSSEYGFHPFKDRLLKGGFG